jgi:hypothetical protein
MCLLHSLLTPELLPEDVPVLDEVVEEVVEENDDRPDLAGQKKLVCRRPEGIKAGTAIGPYRCGD